MGKLYRMDSSGHGLVAKWNVRDPESVKNGESAFAKLRRGGMTMISIEGDGHNRRLDAFDPTAKEVVAIPQLVGG